jgi:hypothetical protein
VATLHTTVTVPGFALHQCLARLNNVMRTGIDGLSHVIESGMNYSKRGKSEP